MFCTQCATPNLAGSVACRACGASLPHAGPTPRSAGRQAARRIAIALLLLAPLLAGALLAGERIRADHTAEAARRAALDAALLAGDVDTARSTARSDDGAAIALSGLEAASADAEAGRTAALGAIADGDWRAARRGLGGAVRELPGDEDARSLLSLATGLGAEELERALDAALVAGDPLAAEKAAAELAGLRPADPRLEELLDGFRESAAPVALARNGALVLSSPDGSDSRVIVDGVPVSRPVWSPDRSRLAFVSSDPYDGGAAAALYVVSADGSDLRRLSSLAHPNAVPSWSPDGMRLAVTSVARWDLRRERGLLVVQSIDASTGAAVDLTSVTGRHATTPAWSPDGETLAFISRPVIDTPLESPLSGPAQVWLWSGRDGMRNLTGDRANGANRLLWAPDGATLYVLTRDRGLAGETASIAAGIRAFDARTGEESSIAEGISAYTSGWGPAASPDGSALAWVAGARTVVIRDAGGQETAVDTGRMLSGALSWSPGGESLLAVSADPALPSAIVRPGSPPSVADADLDYDMEWPTGTPQWSPVLAAPAGPEASTGGAGLDRQ